MKITAAEIHDFKRVRNVRITPDADTFLLLIGGNNAQGKSSVLDAIDGALGGKGALPAEAVRRGAEQASIVLELDGGAYRIERTVPKDGEGKLTITGPDGRIAKPQDWLNRLVGARFLDPLAFLTAAPAKQRQTLAAMVGIDLDSFAAERKALYDERTAVGRVLTAAAAELGRLPPATEPPPAARSQGAIRDELDAVDAEQRAIAEKLAARGRVVDRAAAAIESTKRLRGEVARLQAQLVQQEEQLATDQRAITTFDEELGAGAPEQVAATEARRRALREEAGRAETLARWEAASEVATRQRRRAEDAVRDHGAARDKLTAAIADADARKAAALAAAPMPVAELGITDDGLTLDGLPFEQASRAEQMRCAVAIAMATSPNLKDILVRDASSLDDGSLADLHVQAMFAGCRLWLERVGEKDEGAIIIRDGRVLDAGGVS